MPHKNRTLGSIVSGHCVNRYKERVIDDPKRKKLASNHLRKIIRKALNHSDFNSVIDFGDSMVHPVQFNKNGKNYYLITSQDLTERTVVKTVYTQEMYENKFKNYIF
jgi:hypothetical protein